ncbi:MAG: sulfite exporter TauE/SafE family protein [Actinobacteria bacterium]|nr:sulfite exporter TauE/SafE family protein [Actinomycetota bacterium]
MTWEFTLVGLFTGILVGITGMGGGSLMTPILVFLFGVPPATAIGTDIAHGAAFKSVGALQHRRMGNVRARLAGWMFLGSAPTSLLGVWLATKLASRYGEGAESVMGQILGAALLLGAAGLIAKSLVHRKSVGPTRWRLSTRDRIAAVLVGAFGGFIVGLTSVGSGVFFGLTLLIVFPLRARKVVGTDIFHAAALLYVAGIGHWIAGNVDFAMLAWLLTGSIPGVLMGGRLTLSFPEKGLRVLLAGVLALAGLKLLNVPGAQVIVIVGLSTGLAALAIFVGRQTWSRLRRARNKASGPQHTRAEPR